MSLCAWQSKQCQILPLLVDLASDIGDWSRGSFWIASSAWKTWSGLPTQQPLASSIACTAWSWLHWSRAFSARRRQTEHLWKVLHHCSSLCTPGLVAPNTRQESLPGFWASLALSPLLQIAMIQHSALRLLVSDRADPIRLHHCCLYSSFHGLSWFAQLVRAGSSEIEACFNCLGLLLLRCQSSALLCWTLSIGNFPSSLSFICW